ncbi:unnamed protein product [Rotaria sp. Silwood2]|nr:unnamed protein product [Rotaria sp. Silwood2]
MSSYFVITQRANEEKSKSDPLLCAEDTSSQTPLATTNKKRKKKHLSNEQRLLTDMSDERLQVYGLNPKRFRNFVRFNKDKKEVK